MFLFFFFGRLFSAMWSIRKVVLLFILTGYGLFFLLLNIITKMNFFNINHFVFTMIITRLLKFITYRYRISQQPWAPGGKLRWRDEEIGG